MLPGRAPKARAFLPARAARLPPLPALSEVSTEAQRSGPHHHRSPGCSPDPAADPAPLRARTRTCQTPGAGPSGEGALPSACGGARVPIHCRSDRTKSLQSGKSGAAPGSGEAQSPAGGRRPRRPRRSGPEEAAPSARVVSPPPRARPERGPRAGTPTRARAPRRARGRAEPLPAPNTKRLRGSPPHLQHGAPRAFENHRTPLRRARHSPGLPVLPGAAAAAAISSRSPSPRPRCQVTPFTWAWSSLCRAAPPPRPLPPAPAETAQRPARPQPAHGPRQRRTAAWRIPPAPAPPPPRPHAPLVPHRHEREPVIGQSVAVKG